MDRPPHEYPASMPYPQQPYAYLPPQQFHGGGATPPPPQYLPPPHQQMPFPYHHHHSPAPPPPHHLMHHLQQPPPPLPPPQFHHAPADPELQKRIDKLVEYSAKNGHEFESMIREKQKDNPDYAFLFGGDGHAYYRHRLWLSLSAARPPFAVPNFPPPSMLRPPHPPAMIHAPPPPQQQQPYYYDSHQGGHGQFFPRVAPMAEFEQPAKPSKGLSGPLPGDVAADLAGVLAALNGTKESIKGTKFWFVQRSVFASALAEALRDRVFALDDLERQLHIIYLANDILFESVHRRTNEELDNEALAFKPVLGSMLSRIYHHPHIQEDSQSKLQQLLQLWASNNIYDLETINTFRNEMVGGHPFPGTSKDLPTGSLDSSAGLPPQGTMMHNMAQWHPDRQIPVPNLGDQDHLDKLIHHQTMPVPVPVFPGPMLAPAAAQPATHQPLLPAPTPATGEKAPVYPLFPPGLIPGMVRKMQIGSGVPYSPMSPLDIPTTITPSTASLSETLDRVSKFFKEIGEVNPSEEALRSDGADGGEIEIDGFNREAAVRKGGACIPPPPNLQADPDTGTYADGTVERKPGFNSSGRLGVGATANPNEISQYDDVYSSYRKHRSTNYHSSMSAKATAR